MFWTRVASGIVLLIILGSVFGLGGPVLGIFFAAVSLVGMYEFYRAVGLIGKETKTNLLTNVGYISCICLYAMLIATSGDIRFLIMVPAVSLIAMLGVYVFTYPKYNDRDVVYTFFGFCYLSITLCFVYNVRCLPEGKYMVWLVFMSSWICDIFAYCVGMLFGKHKLAPILSPKKSIEGSVGGVVFSALFGGLYGYFVQGYISSQFNAMIVFAVVSAVGAIVSQVGDLSASAVKRKYEIKDYGHLIPGHGGILDRFDSVIFAAPMVYLVAILFG